MSVQCAVAPSLLDQTLRRRAPGEPLPIFRHQSCGTQRVCYALCVLCVYSEYSTRIICKMSSSIFHQLSSVSPPRPFTPSVHTHTAPILRPRIVLAGFSRPHHHWLWRWPFVRRVDLHPDSHALSNRETFGQTSEVPATRGYLSLFYTACPNRLPRLPNPRHDDWLTLR